MRRSADVSPVDDFLNFLGSRYAKARTELDEVRIRAMELVLAACITELRENPPIVLAPTRRDDALASYLNDEDDDRDFKPPGDLDETSELDVESYLKDEFEWSEDPRPRRVAPPEPAPEPTPEPAPTSEVDLPASETQESDDEPLTDATNWSSFSSDDEERAPEEPVRGAWQAPEN